MDLNKPVVDEITLKYPTENKQLKNFYDSANQQITNDRTNYDDYNKLITERESERDQGDQKLTKSTQHHEELSTRCDRLESEPIAVKQQLEGKCKMLAQPN